RLLILRYCTPSALYFILGSRHIPDLHSFPTRRSSDLGRSGQALLFVTPRERRLLAQIERATRQPLTEIQLPSVDDVNEVRMAKFAQSITESLGDPNLGLFRRLVEEYRSEERRVGKECRVQGGRKRGKKHERRSVWG